MEEKSAEIAVLKRQAEELGQGQTRLQGMVAKIQKQEEEVDRGVAILEQKKVTSHCSLYYCCGTFKEKWYFLSSFVRLSVCPTVSLCVKVELEKIQERAEAQAPLDPDEAVEAGCPLYRSCTCTLLLPPSRQLMAAYAEEGATSDAIYFLGKALGDNVVGCEAYLKQVIVTLWVYKAFTKPPPDLQTSYMT